MRRSLCALLAVPVALATAGPALAAKDKDAFNSTGLRKAVTLEGIREHQQNLQFIADAYDGVRTSGTPGYDASVAYVEGPAREGGLRRQAAGVPVRLLQGHRAAGVRPGLAAARGVHHAR